jgi:hypothetical protein
MEARDDILSHPQRMLYISVSATVSLKALRSIFSTCEIATEAVRRKRDANIQNPLAADGII